MGFLSAFNYINKNGKKYWLHVKTKGKTKIYYFSKNEVGSLHDLPPGFEVIENPKTGLPFLKKKTSAGLFGKPKVEKKGGEKTSEEKKE